MILELKPLRGPASTVLLQSAFFTDGDDDINDNLELGTYIIKSPLKFALCSIDKEVEQSNFNCSNLLSTRLHVL